MTNTRRYQRMFRFDGLRMSHIDIFMYHYSQLNVVQTCLGKKCMSLMPDEDMNYAGLRGVTLYSDAGKFGDYMKGWREFIDEFQSLADEIASLDEISKEVATRWVVLARRIFFFSSRTEFFYLDQAYIESEDNPQMRANMNETYKLKEWFRENVMNAFFLGQDCHFHALLKKLGRQFEVDWEDLLDYRLDEIVGLYDGEQVGEEILTQRRQAIVAVGQSGKVDWLTGDEAAEQALKLQRSLGEEGEEIVTRHGMAANPGQAKGKVKIILGDVNTYDKRVAEFSKMNQGDILVAENTSPDLMPACKMAGAILTDQGGLLSHAAVVSRELGIPCVVGLKNLTEVLEDGDMVEVDAGEGTVKIL